MQVQSQSQRNPRPARRPAAWLALLAIWLHALLPALHHPAGMALAGDPAGFDQSNFCHAPAPEPASPGAPDKGHHLPPCALCQSVHAVGGFAPPSAVPLPFAVQGEAVVFAAGSRDFMVPRRPHDRQQPRAPPVPA